MASDKPKPQGVVIEFVDPEPIADSNLGRLLREVDVAFVDNTLGGKVVGTGEFKLRLQDSSSAARHPRPTLHRVDVSLSDEVKKTLEDAAAAQPSRTSELRAKLAAAWSTQLNDSLRTAIDSAQSAAFESTLLSAANVYEQLMQAAASAADAPSSQPPVLWLDVLRGAGEAAESVLGQAKVDVQETLQGARAAAEADLDDAVSAAAGAGAPSAIALDAGLLEETNRLLQELVTSVKAQPSRAKFGVVDALQLATLIVAIATLAVAILAWQHPASTTPEQSAPQGELKSSAHPTLERSPSAGAAQPHPPDVREPPDRSSEGRPGHHQTRPPAA